MKRHGPASEAGRGGAEVARADADDADSGLKGALTYALSFDDDNVLANQLTVDGSGVATLKAGRDGFGEGSKFCLSYETA